MVKTLGIIGGGQLGRLLCEATRPLGIRTIVLDPTPDSPAGQVADRQIIGDYVNPADIKKLAKQVDVLTWEIESANAETLIALKKQGVKIEPSPQQLALIQDKFLQKKLLRYATIPVADFCELKSPDELVTIAQKWHYPLLLKARRHAFDGRGNYLVRSGTDIPAALAKLGKTDLYVERYIPFQKELAIQVGRTRSGRISLFPLVETIQKNNICHSVLAPARVATVVTKQALGIARKVAHELKGAGIFGIEFFLTTGNDILVNEIAPRVHNSGHYTIEACNVSQFEQHVRLVCGLPAKKIKLLSPAVMINILGDRTGPISLQGLEKIKNKKNIAVHIYGKKDVKPERKMGHLTALGETVDTALRAAISAKKTIHI